MAINSAIRDEEARLRTSLPFLEHQSAIALSIWALSLTAMLSLAAAYLHGALPALLVIPCSAFFASLLHELEHDLIHNLYFKGAAHKWVQDVLFFGIWVAKLSLNPWTRRGWHLLHHRRSGQVEDVEERLLGLGVKNLPLRLASAVLPWLAAIYVIGMKREVPRDKLAYKTLRGAHCSLERLTQNVDMAFIMSPVIAAVLAARGSKGAAAFLVCWAGPNVLRHACLALMSSFSHYYGDVDPSNVMQQNQILRHWALLPLQAFCCNFGAGECVLCLCVFLCVVCAVCVWVLLYFTPPLITPAEQSTSFTTMLSRSLFGCGMACVARPGRQWKRKEYE